jgi:hypothetical protein
MPNGRCYLHGGPSTGPRTRKGRARSRRANWKLGFYSAKAKAERRQARALARAMRQLIAFGVGIGLDSRWQTKIAEYFDVG